MSRRETLALAAVYALAVGTLAALTLAALNSPWLGWLVAAAFYPSNG